MKHLKKFEGIDNVSQLRGWVNVKIDNQLFIRMAKYVTALDSIMDPSLKYNLHSKLSVLAKIGEYIKRNDIDVQTKISIITLLQYLNEIKVQFNPSSSGFLLEGFLATLIHGKMLSDYGAVDVTGKNVKADLGLAYSERPAPQFEAPTQTSKKIKYQIKLYKKGNNIKVSWNPDNLCDFYVICLKDGEDIDVHILTSDPTDKDTYIGKFKVEHRTDAKKAKSEKFMEINTNKLYSIGNAYKLTLKVSTRSIEAMIKKCGDEVKKSIASIYGQLSELQYDVDALVTGVDKNKRKVTVDQAKSKADNTISNITDDISNLGGQFK